MPAAAPAIKTTASPGVDYYATKLKLHQKLLTRIDLNSIESLTPEQLRKELGVLLITLIEEDSTRLNNQERAKLVADLTNEIMGLGPLEPLLADPTISEIMVNGYQKVYVEKSGRIQLTDIRFNDDAHLMKIIDKMSSHQMGFSEMLGIAKLHGKMPKEIVMIGAPPKDLEMNIGLSPELNLLLPEAVAEGRVIIEGWLTE